MRVLSDLIKNFVPAKTKVREEVKAQGEGQLAIGENSLSYWQERLGWSPQAARYLATAFTFGVSENVAAVLERAQDLSDSDSFESEFTKRVGIDPSILGPTLEAARFTNEDDLRDLLSRVLAEEVDNLGTISKRTVSVAKDLGPRDLEEFLKLRAATWIVEHPHSETCLLVLGLEEKIGGLQFLSFDSDKIGVTYHAFGEFQQLGLLQERADGNAVTRSNPDLDSPIRLRHGQVIVSITSLKASLKLPLGRYAFTKAGSEIINLFLDEDFAIHEGYFEEVCRSWSSRGVEICVLP